MIRAILFDLDGTLIDTSEYIFQAFEHTLKTHGLNKVPRTKMRQHVGRSLEHTYQSLTGVVQVRPLFKTHQTFQQANLALVKSYAGTNTVLKKFHTQGLKLAIITSRWGYIKETLKVAGVDFGLFDLVVSASDVKNHKPHPEPINLALRKLKLKRSEAVMVGDGVADIEAAKAAGVITIGLTHGFGYKSHLKAAGADYLISTFKELPAVISGL